MPRPKLSFFLSHPVQYISPLLKALARHTDLHVYYFSDASIKGGMDKGFGQAVKWDVPLLEGYDYTFIKNYSKKGTLSNKFLELINPGLFGHVRKEPARVIVVNGWMYLSVVATIVFGKLTGKKIWMRAENPLHQELKKSKKTIFLKRILLQRLLFPLVDKFLYIGSQNRKFFQFYGASEQQLVYTPYAVDNEFFGAQYQQYKGRREALLAELNLPQDKKIILFTAKYITQKRPLDLLQAFSAMQHKNALLVMVGEGALRPEMEHFIQTHKVANVVLTGFVNQSAIAKYYAVADAFVMCSGMGETWGLSVNEAMNFGLPVIVSQTCGCSYDLVQEGVNGFTFAEGDVPALSAAMDRVVSDETFARTAGAASLAIIKDFGIDTIVHNMTAALQPDAKKAMPLTEEKAAGAIK